VVKDPDLALERLEERLGRLLKFGAGSAATCLFVGLVLWMGGGPRVPADRILSAGLIILMATPIVRVIVSLVAYVRMRDWFFVATTVAVFGVLIATVVLALVKV
jgi:Protein of unknown function (DUF1634)